MEEIWKETKYSGYFISNYGRLRGRSGRIIKSYLNKRAGYYMICIHPNGRNGKSKCLKIHRLVAEAYVLNPNNYLEVNHIDGNKLNNKADNLEWCTPSENRRHAFRLGLAKAKRGWYNKQSKLTEQDVDYIRKNYIAKDKIFGCRALGKAFNVPHITISKIIRNLNYYDCDHNSKVE